MSPWVPLVCEAGCIVTVVPPTNENARVRIYTTIRERSLGRLENKLTSSSQNIPFSKVAIAATLTSLLFHFHLHTFCRVNDVC